MKALTCEMCGSTNLIKQDGIFVCQSCGTKYSIEEAKKMMIEGTVDIQGTVKVDTSDELKNLYEIARRAKDTSNSENALKYYDMILVKDPSSWEANFYVVYFRAMSCKIAEIESAGYSIVNCLEPVITLIKNNISEETESILSEICIRCTLIAKMLSSGAKNHYEGIDWEISQDYLQEYINNVFAAMQIMYSLGDLLVTTFQDKYGVLASDAWKNGIEIHKEIVSFLDNKQSNQDCINSYGEKIKKYEPSYIAPIAYQEEITPTTVGNTGSGCYIATAVYGTYNCPQVWTLRRFRDYTLAETWYGRAFIRTYYALSPTLVKWFGQTIWFKKICKDPIDRLVRKLQSEGFKNTPYEDRKW
jgi:hypothetical protein